MDLDKFTANAKRWYNEYNKVGEEFSDEQIYFEAYSRIEDSLGEMFMSELMSAIEQAPAEYSYAPLKDRLVSVFQRNLYKLFGFRVVNNRAVINVRMDMIYENVGDETTFWQGVGYARAIIASGSTKVTPERSARIWKYQVYLNEDQTNYEVTIQLRLEGWGEYAPYWFLLEYGNADSTFAFPRFRGKHFIMKFEERASDLLEKTSIKLADQYYRDIGADLRNLENDLENATPGQTLRILYENGIRYKLYKTRTGLLGYRQT